MIRTEQEAAIISKSAQGLTCREIGDQTGLHFTTVYKYQQKQDNRALIQRETEAILNGGLKVSRKVLNRCAAEGLRQFKQDKPDKELIKLSLDASKTILNVAGLTGSPSTLIQTMVNIHQGNEGESNINLLRDYLQARMPAIPSQQVDINRHQQTSHPLSGHLGTGIQLSRTSGDDCVHDITPSNNTVIQPVMGGSNEV